MSARTCGTCCAPTRVWWGRARRSGAPLAEVADIPLGYTSVGTVEAVGDPKLRERSYAAHPGESVVHASIFTTLFPHLGQHKVHEFRWAFLAGLGGILILYLAGLITAAIYPPRRQGSERLYLSGLVGPRAGHTITINSPRLKISV